jgi:hypothetical protein
MKGASSSNLDLETKAAEATPISSIKFDATIIKRPDPKRELSSLITRQTFQHFEPTLS